MLGFVIFVCVVLAIGLLVAICMIVHDSTEVGSVLQMIRNRHPSISQTSTLMAHVIAFGSFEQNCVSGGPDMRDELEALKVEMENLQDTLQEIGSNCRSVLEKKDEDERAEDAWAESIDSDPSMHLMEPVDGDTAQETAAMANEV